MSDTLHETLEGRDSYDSHFRVLWPDGSTRVVSARGDNETNRLVLASQLRAWGVAADVAVDAEQALERLRIAAAEAKPYDLALVDMAMPAMDGLELAGVVRADRRLAAVRLLLLSSVSVEAEAAAREGFVGRLTKPVRLSDLYDALVRAVEPSSAAVAYQPSSSVAAGSRGTLLIVEDHAINQEVARGIVATLGYGSDVVGDGIEALEALERRNYDAVLMDCHMPGMDGFQATAEIRRREAGRSHVPIIAMTAAALVEDREKCIAAGMDDYLAKPVKDRDLDATLRRWLGSRPGSPDDRDPGRYDGVLDAARFDGLRRMATAGGDPGLLSRLVDQYLDWAASELAELRQAAERGDELALRRVAHGLKGTSATMGASGVATACPALEAAAARGEVVGAEAMDRIPVELEGAAIALCAQAPTQPS